MRIIGRGRKVRAMSQLGAFETEYPIAFYFHPEDLTKVAEMFERAKFHPIKDAEAAFAFQDETPLLEEIDGFSGRVHITIYKEGVCCAHIDDSILTIHEIDLPQSRRLIKHLREVSLPSTAKFEYWWEENPRYTYDVLCHLKIQHWIKTHFSLKEKFKNTDTWTTWGLRNYRQLETTFNTFKRMVENNDDIFYIAAWCMKNIAATKPFKGGNHRTGVAIGLSILAVCNIPSKIDIEKDTKLMRKLFSLDTKSLSDALRHMSDFNASKFSSMTLRTIDKYHSSNSSSVNLSPQDTLFSENISVSNIIISAPHALPPGKEMVEHEHDEITYPLSQLLASNLEKHGFTPHVVIKTGSRIEKDPNRAEGRDTEFRQLLRQQLSELCHPATQCLLIDLHSYPPSSRDYGKYDICLLLGNNIGNSLLYDTLADALVRQGYGVGLFSIPQQRLDIIREAWETCPTIEVVLIEVNEKYREDLKLVAHHIADAICNTLSIYDVTENPLEAFDTTTTDMPYYDEMLASPQYFKKAKGKEFKIVYISPDEYMRVSAACRSAGRGRSIEQEQHMVIDRLVKKYAKAMKHGTKFPMPILELDIKYIQGKPYLGEWQEGRHRAMAAKSIGIQSIPIMLIYPTDPTEYQIVKSTVPLFDTILKGTTTENPPATTAEQRYETFQDLPVDYVFGAELPEPHPPLTKIDEFEQATYHCSKWSGRNSSNKNVRYYHNWKRNYLYYATDANGHPWFIGKIRTLKDGIDDWIGTNDWKDAERIKVYIPRKLVYLGMLKNIILRNGKMKKFTRTALCTDPSGTYLYPIKLPHGVHPTHPDRD